MNAAEVVKLIEAHRFRYTSEDQLQTGIAEMLRSKGANVEREVKLTPLDRIDMLVDGVGIEVKIAGAPATVRRQLARYAGSDRIRELVLVTNRVRHVFIAPEMNGKPVVVVPIVHP